MWGDLPSPNGAMFLAELLLIECRRTRSFPGGSGTLKETKKAQVWVSTLGVFRKEQADLRCRGGVLTLKRGCTLEAPGELVKLPLPRLHQLTRVSGAIFLRNSQGNYNAIWEPWRWKALERPTRNDGWVGMEKRARTNSWSNVLLTRGAATCPCVSVEP